MKFRIFITFIFTTSILYSQEESKILALYQSILDHPEFIKIIEKDTLYLCQETLYYKPNSLDSNTTLKYKGKNLIITKLDTNNNCSLLTFGTPKNKRKFSLIAHMTSYGKEERIGKCLFGKSVSFECKIKRKKAKYKILKTSTLYWTSAYLL